MLNTADLPGAFDSFERKTLDAIAEARKLTLPEASKAQFLTSKLTDAEVKRVREALPKPTQKDIKAKSVGFLYVFAQRQGCSVDRLDIVSVIKHAKSGGADKVEAMTNLCAINTDAPEGRVLYVGRSWDPRARIAGHLRASTGKTYAIHFAAWAQKLELQVEVYVYAFPGIADRVLQVVEDATWDRFDPLFGRRGEK